MNIRHGIVLVLLLMVSSCAQLPKIQKADSTSAVSSFQDCESLFPQGRWQLFHTIEASMPGGRKSSLVGVTVLSSGDRSIRWALMTLEGFVLFSGHYDGDGLTVERAVGPFNQPGFAQGLMEDLQLLFFKPDAPLTETGVSRQGDRIYRYASDDQTIDMTIKSKNRWDVRQYNKSKRLVRSIEADGMVLIGASRFARHLVLTNHHLIGYSLKLKLVDAVPLD